VLKIRFSMDDVESHAAEVLEQVLREIPALKLKSIQIGSKARDTGIDIMMRAEVSGEPHLLVCEVKQSGQPRYARDAVMSLRHYITEQGKPATPSLSRPTYLR
jgi:hypothetical protein